MPPDPEISMVVRWLVRPWICVLWERLNLLLIARVHFRAKRFHFNLAWVVSFLP